MSPVGAARAGTRIESVRDDLQHIETKVASGDSTIDFTNVFTSDYDRYVIFVDNIISGIDGEVLQARYSSDGGSTWDSGTSDYARANFRVLDGGTTTAIGESGTSEIRIGLSALANDPANNDTFGASIIISEPTKSDKATVQSTSASNYKNTDNEAFKSEFSGGIRLAQSAIDSIQFQARSGNISSGIFSVFGVDQ